MTTEIHARAIDGEEGTGARPRKRVLIEASKLADEKMDGIKRYVVELLRAFARMKLDDEVELYVMVLDRAHPFAELPSWYLAYGEQAPGEAPPRPKPASSGLDRWLRGISGLVPPILLYPIRWLIPAWAARRFLGKEKSDLYVPALDPAGRNLPALLLPPLVFSLLQKLLPERLVLFLWARGMLEPAPRAVDPSSYDLLHLTLPNNYHYFPPTPTRMLVTVHDLCQVSCPEYQTRANFLTLKLGLDRAVAGGASFLAVSEATRAQMIDEYALEAEHVTTVQSGCSAERFHPVHNPETRARACRKYRIPESPFLLTLSTIEPRKNLARTVEAFGLLVRELVDSDVVLVIAGARGWKSRDVARAAGASERVHLTGYIDDADLAAVYSAARGFVYASHYEGFGFPLLEAMRCGVPVVYGNNSSMPALVDDAGLAADSRDVADLARQMRRLVCDDELAESLGRRALERAVEFTWDRAAAQTVVVYEKLLGLRLALW
jgi:glycosyltransferase involved in cell wall biosynthesis